MGWDPLSGRNFQTGNVPRNKQFGKRKQEDDVLDSPAPRRSKRTKKKAKTNDVIDICSDSEDENIVITESETAIPEKEECDVTKVKFDGVQTPGFLSPIVFNFTDNSFPLLVQLETTCN